MNKAVKFFYTTFLSLTKVSVLFNISYSHFSTNLPIRRFLQFFVFITYVFFFLCFFYTLNNKITLFYNQIKLSNKYHSSSNYRFLCSHLYLNNIWRIYTLYFIVYSAKDSSQLRIDFKFMLQNFANFYWLIKINMF